MVRAGNAKLLVRKTKSLAGLGIAESDPSQRLGVALVRVEPGERDGLVADEAGASVDRMRVSALGLEVRLGAHDEEAPVCEDVQPIEVDVAAIHDVEGAGLGQQTDRGY